MNEPLTTDNPNVQAMQRIGMNEPGMAASMIGTQLQQLTELARRYPRDPVTVERECIEAATIDPETANSCFYIVPKGRKQVPGMSIRLAEILYQHFGNLWVQTVPSGRDHNYVYIQATAWELERNVCHSAFAARQIRDKDGALFSTDLIQLTIMAGASVAFRNAMFRTVPQPIQLAVYQAATDVARGDAKSLKQRRDSMLDAFLELKVGPERVLASIGVERTADIDLDHLLTLRGYYNAIKVEGMDPGTIFPKIQPETVDANPVHRIAGDLGFATDPEPDEGAIADAQRDDRKAEAAIAEDEPPQDDGFGEEVAALMDQQGGSHG